MFRLIASIGVLVSLSIGSELDATRLRTGRFSYNVRDQQKEVATGVLEVSRNASGTYAFAGTFTAAVCQHWESTAARDFEPASALLRFCKDGPDRPVFELTYAGARVSGARYTGTPNPQRQPVDAAVAADTVDQRIDWAAVMALDLRPGVNFGFHVYDPGTGVSPLIGRVAGVEDIEVPAGRFKAYRLQYKMTKAGHDEQYQSLVTVDVPRMLLKIQFPNGTTSELVDYR